MDDQPTAIKRSDAGRPVAPFVGVPMVDAADAESTDPSSSLSGALLALTSDAVILFGDKGTVYFANEEAQSLFSQGEQAVGADVRSLFLPTEGDAAIPGSEIVEGSLPFSLDGTTTKAIIADAGGRAREVAVRCKLVQSKRAGRAYLAVCHLIDLEYQTSRTCERKIEELQFSNHRLSGMLGIVLHTLDSEDVVQLFDRVVKEVTDTMQATGTLVYLAEKDGFVLRGQSGTTRARRIPQYMPFGRAIEDIITQAGHALRLHVQPVGTEELRAGVLISRKVFDEDAHSLHEVPSNLLPPFVSFLAVPVWFGGHVIAIIEVGWEHMHLIRKEEAQLLDSVAQYLSVQLVAAFASMRARHAEHLEAVASEIRLAVMSAVEDAPSGDASKGTGVDVVSEALKLMARACSATLVMVEGGEGSIRLHGPGSLTSKVAPFSLDALAPDRASGQAAVVTINPKGDFGRWLSDASGLSVGALVDLGEMFGTRICTLFLRPFDAEPLEDIELDFLRRCARDMRSVERGEAKRSNVKRISQALQTGMKNELQKVAGISADGIYTSATAEAFVGGDFYDLIRLPGRRACIIMGDVSGKGIEAASVSAAVKTALGAYAWQNLSPAQMVRSLNDFMLGFSRIETFATLFVGVIDLVAGSIEYCSAGHPPALLLKAGGEEFVALDVQSGLVGAFPEMSYRNGRVGIGVGDELLLYTDGTTEARSPGGAFFGEDGLRDMVTREYPGGFDGMLPRLLEGIEEFTGHSLNDDVALVLLRFDEIGEPAS